MRQFIDIVESARDDIATKLQSQGYQQIGAGQNALVFAKDGDNEVIKLFPSWDEGYIKFYHFIQSHPNPHWPVLTELTEELSGYFVVKCERLMPAKYANDYAHILDRLAVAIKQASDTSTWEKDLPDTMVDAIKLLVENFLNHGWMLDLANGSNLMARGNTMVLIDPIGFKLIYPDK